MASAPGMQQTLPVSALGVETQASFITNTYMHLFGAILAFASIEVFLFTSGMAEGIARSMLSVNWMLVLGAFMIVSWFATRVAHRATSLPAQYAALGGFIVAQALIFVPMLYMAQQFAPGVLQSAATVTLMGFAALTAIAFVTRKDFSFLGGLLKWGFMVALVLIAASLIFGFHLGTFFSVAMIALAGAAILRDTSNVIHHYPRDRYVAASLQLFASVALMFWYVLRLFMSRD